jgi:hypothetical protein
LRLGIETPVRKGGPIPADALEPALGDAARTALDPVLMILLSACCLHQRYFQ